MKRWRAIAALVLMAAWPVAAASGADENLAEEVRELRRLVFEQREEIDKLKAAAGGATPQQTALEQQRELIREMIKSELTRSQANDFRVFWKDGLKLETNDGAVKMEIGGRMMYDFMWISGSDVEERLGVDLEDGAQLRRGRLHVAGTYVPMAVDFKIEFDWAGGNGLLRDTYLRFREIAGVGSVTAGHFKEPFSLEELTSSRYITFLERGLPSAFVPSRNVGVMLADTALDQRMTWAAGVFMEADDSGAASEDGQYAFTSRVTALPVYEEKGRRLLHLGMAYSYRNAGGNVRFRQRPEAGQAPRFVDTGLFDAESQNLIGAEIAYVHDSFHAQAEYIANLVSSDVADDPHFSGFYIAAGYFLTGEVRPYSRSGGVFDRVKPLKNYRQDGGCGAWEIAGRYSYLDLNDGTINGGRLQDITLGLNWYLNPNVRIMWNYVHSILSNGVGAGGNDHADIFLMRLQFDF